MYRGSVFVLAVGCVLTVLITSRMLKFHTSPTSATKDHVSDLTSRNAVPRAHVPSEFVSLNVIGKSTKANSKKRSFSRIFSPSYKTFSTVADVSRPVGSTVRDPSEQGKQHVKSCVEKRHLVFVKVHKAGSSTVTNVLIRFGISRNLSFVLPRKGVIITFWQDKSLDNVMESPNGLPFDLLCNHAVYSPINMDKIMHQDTLYFGIVREPISLVHSAIHYFFKKRIPGDHKLSQYINNPQMVPNRRLLNNSMSYEFGLPPADFFNMEKIKTHLNKLNEEFSVIIVMERMSESLLLIRRHMCWKLKDILYIPRNTNIEKPDLNISHQETVKLNSILMADVALYKFSLERLDKQISEQGKDFWNELAVYRSLLNKVRDYCLGPRDTSPELNFPRTRWSDQFTLYEDDCYVLSFNGFQILNFAKRYQYPNNYKS